MEPESQPPFLLTLPSYSGTLAALRCLDQLGVGVTVASAQLLSAARWSRHARRVVRCPPTSDPRRFVDWLLGFAENEPKHVLYPTSDCVAFLIAAHAAELEERFFLYQPSLQQMVRILDKQRLYEACAAVGLATVPTWYPRDESDVRRIAAEEPGPFLLKPRTQVLRTHQSKGTVVARPEDLVAANRAFAEHERYAREVQAWFGDVTQPMIQRFMPVAAESVVSITGFVDRTAKLHAVRASRKVFQRTSPVGLGLCFEAAPLEESLEEAALRLCRELGHFGIFEIEFLRDGGNDRVIDFNPRFYGQMGFDIARGLPLPYLVWLASVGDLEHLRVNLQEAARDESGGAEVFTHRLLFEALLLGRRLRGSLSHEESKRWRRWLADHRGHRVDAATDAHDPLPAAVDAVADLATGVRWATRRVLRPRAFPPRPEPTPEALAGLAQPEPAAGKSNVAS